MPKKSKTSDSLTKLYSKVASKILTESIRLKKGESITIETWNNGQTFAQKVAMDARKIGAIPLMLFEDQEAYVYGVKTMDKEVSGKMGKHEYALLSGSDAYVFIPGPPLSSYYSGLTGEERSSSLAYNTSWYEAAEKAKLRGVRLTFGYVGKDMSKALGKAPDKIIEHQLKAIIEPDFSSMTRAGQQIAQYLQDGATCTVSSSNGSKLEFRLQGDTEVEDGIVDDADISSGNNMIYMPPGLVSKRVESSTVTGMVKGFWAATSSGLIRDGMLEFESGKLVKWESKSSKKVLDKTVQSINEDTRKLAAFSVGMNASAKLGYGIDRFVNCAIGLSVTSRLSAILQRASVSVDGKEIVASGKLASA
ncbi:MAG: M29 family metallopeptidase [Nitrososphaerales archaeon]